MTLLVFAAVLVAWYYYSNVNKSEDPRVVEVKYMYLRYNNHVESENFDQMLLVLDSIEHIYNQVDHYKQSYELGVALNNKAAIYLTLALHHIQDSLEKVEYLEHAGNFASKSIEIYHLWFDAFDGLKTDEIKKKILPEFGSSMLKTDESRAEKVLAKRIKDIQEAQFENSRRLSVSYTNLGIVHRHYKQYELAAENYKKAIDLWEENLTARNNLNLLVGRPLEKQSIIKKLFPPDRKKKSD